MLFGFFKSAHLGQLVYTNVGFIPAPPDIVASRHPLDSGQVQASGVEGRLLPAGKGFRLFYSKLPR
jgi:hypothetical protein